MTLASLALGNLSRHKARAALTVGAFAVAVLAFVLARTVVAAWHAAEDLAAADRLATRNRVSFTLVLPRTYVEVVRGVEGVEAATFASWFAGRDPRDPKHVFTSLAVDAESYLQVYEEIELDERDRQRWLAEKDGVILGAELATRLGVRVGDPLVLTGTIYPGEWHLRVSGIFHGQGVTRRQLLLRWDHLDAALPAWRRGRIGWIVSRGADRVARAIDAAFADREVRTATSSERAVQKSFQGMLAALLSALDVASLALAAIMALVLGNAMAMGVRERVTEHAVLAALGFRPWHVVGLVVLEALATAAVAVGLGVGAGYLLVDRVLGGWIADNLSGFFPWFHVPGRVIVQSAGLGLAVALVSSLLPAWQATRLGVIDALRREA